MSCFALLRISQYRSQTIVNLPGGTGKKVKVAVVCEESKSSDAKSAGADIVGSDEFIEKIKGGEMNFEKLICTPSMMIKLSKLGKVLGPKGLMPNPKLGTVTNDIIKSVNEFKNGLVEVKNDKDGNLASTIGRKSFPTDKLLQNFNYFIDAIKKEKTETIKGEFIKNIYISSNVGDAGGAIGAGLFVSNLYDEEFKNKKISHSYYGSKYSNRYVEENIINQTNLSSINLEHSFIKDFDILTLKVVEYLKNKKIVGWFQDKMEWGPRALGNRSILAHPEDINVRDKINLMVKNREDFRPFAPSILDENVSEFLDVNLNSYFMNYVSKANDKAKKKIGGTVHVDNTCRFHTVSKHNNFKFYTLIKHFFNETGVPAILNTSLNMNEPICENPLQAFDLFAKSSLDVLVIQNWVFIKK